MPGSNNNSRSERLRLLNLQSLEARRLWGGDLVCCYKLVFDVVDVNKISLQIRNRMTVDSITRGHSFKLYELQRFSSVHIFSQKESLTS